MLDQLMVNLRIVYNVDKQLDAKEYQLKIARGIVDQFSSRSRGVSMAPKKRKSESAKPVVLEHMLYYGSHSRCKYCMAIGKDLKSHVHCSTCNVALCFSKERNCFREYHDE